MADDFLSGLQQTDVRVEDLDFKMPAVAKDATIFGAWFPASVKKLRKLLPSEGMAPAQLLPGTGLIAIGAYEHRDTDIGSYNEFSVTIPLYSPRFPKIPLYNLFKSISENENYNFLLHRAANSEAAVCICKDLFLFPEFHASFEFTESDDWMTCEVEEDGELICRLRGRKIPTKRGEVSKYFISTPQHIQFQLVDMNQIQVATSRDSSDAELALGSTHPIAVELSETIKSDKPRIYVYAPNIQWAAYGPEESPKT